MRRIDVAVFLSAFAQSYAEQSAGTDGVKALVRLELLRQQIGILIPKGSQPFERVGIEHDEDARQKSPCRRKARHDPLPITATDQDHKQSDTADDECRGQMLFQ